MTRTTNKEKKMPENDIKIVEVEVSREDVKTFDLVAFFSQENIFADFPVFPKYKSQ